MTAARDRREQAARALAERDVDCIVAAGGPVSSIAGRDAEQQFIAEMSEELRVPFTTVLSAHVDALQHVGADSILVITPFPPERDDETTAYLRAAGFDIAGVGGIALSDTYETRKTPTSVVYDSIRAASVENRAYDTIYVACAPFGAVDHITAIERDFDSSVVMSTQAQVWKAFEMGDISPDIRGYGELFG